jgi:hypothetical protein
MVNSASLALIAFKPAHSTAASTAAISIEFSVPLAVADIVQCGPDDSKALRINRLRDQTKPQPASC